MRKFKKVISFLLLSVYLSAIFIQNVAFAMEGGERERILNDLTFSINATEFTMGDTVEYTVAYTGEEEILEIILHLTDPIGSVNSYTMDQVMDNVFKTHYTIEELTKNGEYSIDNVLVRTTTNTYTIWGNVGYISTDFSDYSYTVMGTWYGVDHIKSMDISGHTFEEGERIEVSMLVDETYREFEGIYLHYSIGQYIHETIYMTRDPEFPHTFKGFLDVKRYTAPGTYTLSSIQMNYADGMVLVSAVNLGQHGIEKDLTPYGFTIEGTLLDQEAPIFHGITMDGQLLNRDVSTIGVTVQSEDESGTHSGRLIFESAQGEELMLHVHQMENGELGGQMNIDLTKKPGTYQLKLIQLTDYAGNSVYIADLSERDDAYEEDHRQFQDLSTYYVQLADTFYGIAPELTITASEHRVVDINETVSFTFKVHSPVDDFTSLQATFYNQQENTYYGIEGTKVADNEFRVDLTLNGGLLLGQYDLRNISLMRGDQRLHIESQSFQEGPFSYDFDNMYFQVDKLFSSYTPVFGFGDFEKVVQLGETLHVEMNVASPILVSYLEVAFVSQRNPEAIIYATLTSDPQSGLYTGQSEIQLFHTPGMYDVFLITYGFDEMRSQIYNEKHAPTWGNKAPLPEGVFEVVGTFPAGEDLVHLELESEGTNAYGPHDWIHLRATYLQPFYDQAVSRIKYVHETDRHLYFYVDAQEGDASQFSTQVNPYRKPGTYQVESVEMMVHHHHITLYNNALESMSQQSLTQDFSALALTIEGTIMDVEAPKFLSMVLPEKIREGDLVDLQFQATDDLSGISHVSLAFKSREGHWLHTWTFYDEKNPDKLILEIGSGQQNGIYDLESVQLYDVAGNRAFYRNKNGSDFHEDAIPMDFSAYFFTYEGYLNYNPEITITTSSKDVQVGEEVLLTVELEDGALDVDQVSLRYTNYGHITLYKTSPRVFQGVLHIPYDIPNGLWTLEEVSLQNKASHESYFSSVVNFVDERFWTEYQWGVKKDLRAGDVQVTGSLHGINPDLETNLQEEILTPGSQKKIQIKIVDDRFVGQSMYAYFRVDTPTGPKTKSVWMQYNEAQDIYEGTLWVYQNDYSGIYRLENIDFYTSTQWLQLTYDLPAFTIKDTLGGYQPKVEVSVTTKEATIGDEVIITLEVADDVINFTHGSFVLGRLHDHTQGYGGFEQISPIMDFTQIAPGVFEYRFTVHEYMREGAYEIYYVNLYSEVQDFQIRIVQEDWHEGEYFEDFSPGAFGIFGTLLDDEPPVLVSVRSVQRQWFVGDEFELELEVEDLSGIASGMAQWSNDQWMGSYYTELIFTTRDGKVYARPKNREYMEGTYKLQELILVDFAGNVVTYLDSHTSEGGIPFDFSGATMTFRYPAIENMTLNINQHTFVPNEKLILKGSIRMPMREHAYVDFLYEVVQVEEIDGERIEQTYSYHVGTSVRPTGNFDLAELIRANRRSGEYKLKTISLYMGNAIYRLTHSTTDASTGYEDLSAYNFTVENAFLDAQGPEFKGIHISKKTVTEGNQILVQVFAEDLGVGLEWGQLHYRNMATGKGLLVNLEKHAFNEYRGFIDISFATSPGEWQLSQIHLYDALDNSSTYRNEDFSGIYGGEPVDLSQATFTVFGTIHDDEGPVYRGATINKNTLSSYEYFNITLDIEDALSGVGDFNIIYTDQFGEDHFFHSYNFRGAGPYVIEGRFYNVEDLQLTAMGINLFDRQGNHTGIYREQVDLSGLDLVVQGKDQKDPIDYLYNAKVLEPNLEYGDVVTMEVILGYEGLDAQGVKLFYRVAGEEEVFALQMSYANDEYHAYMAPDHPKYKALTTYQFMYMEITLANGEVVAIHTPDYPMSEYIFHGGYMDFDILEDHNLKPPTILGFDMEEKEIGVDEFVRLHLVVDAQGHPAKAYKVYFRVDGILLENPTTILSMNHQVFYSTPFTLSGEYTIDHVVALGLDDAQVAVFNAQYHTATEEKATMDFGAQSFVVRSTFSDQTPPTIISHAVASKILEEGDTQQFTVKATDLGSGVDYGVLHLVGPQGHASSSTPVYLYLVEDGEEALLVGHHPITKDTIIGAYQVLSLMVYDKGMNETTLVNENFSEEAHAVDLSSMEFEVQGPLPDVKPPTLLGISLGDNKNLPLGTINLKIDATDGMDDNASGISKVKLNYIANGVQRSFERDIYTYGTDHYVTVTFDQQQSLNWTLRSLELVDFAGNVSVYYHTTGTPEGQLKDLSQGNYVFEKPFVAPTIESLRIDQEEVTAGEAVQVTLRLSSDELLPEKVLVHFSSVIHQRERVLELNITPQGTHEGLMDISLYDLDGPWTLEKISAETAAGRKFEVVLKNTAFEGLSYTVYETTPDDEGADLQDVSLSKVEQTLVRRMMFTLSSFFTSTPNTTTFTLGDTIGFNVTAEDDVSGVEKIKLVYKVVDQLVTIEKTLTEMGKNAYRGEFTIAEFHPSGEWRLESITLYDKALNETVLLKNETTGFVPGYAKLNFRVTGTEPDRTPPVITSVERSVARALLGEKVLYTVKAQDDKSAVTEVTLRLRSVVSGVTKNVTMMKAEEGIFTGTLTVTPDMPGSTWRIDQITAKDSMNNILTVTNTLMNTGALSSRRDFGHAEVSVVTEQRIEIKAPTTITLNLGDVYLGEDLKVDLVYSDGSVKELSVDQLRRSTIDTTKIGTQTFTVSYNALRTTKSVVVQEGKVASLKATYTKEKPLFVGDTLKMSDLGLEVTYENGFKRTVPVEESWVSGFDTETAGTKTLTIHYGSESTQITLSVLEIQLASIAIKYPPTKQIYVLGEAFMEDGLVVEGTYNNGTTAILSRDAYSITGFDSTKVTEEQIITVLSQGKEATFTIAIKSRVVVSLAVKTLPKQMVYVQGQSISLEGLVLEGTYNDEQVASIPLSEILIKPYDNEQLGVQTITLQVDGITIALEVTFIKKVVSSIDITTKPTMVQYIQGQSLNLEGLEVTATYNDGEKRILGQEEFSITGFDSSVPVVAQVITVTFEGKEAAFEVDILAKKLTSLRVKALPTKTVYVEGQELDLQGLVVEGTYNDGSKKELDGSEVTHSGYDKNILGEQTITLTVDQVKTTFTVEVIQKIATQLDITKEPTKITYIQGQSFDLTGLVVKAAFNDGSVRTLAMEELTITGFDSRMPMEAQVITVTFEKVQATFRVEILAKKLTALAVKTLPTKTVYVEGQSLDLQGLVLEGTYNDGNVETVDVALLTVTGYDKNTLGEQTITIAVDEVKTTFTVEVIKKVVTNVAITKEPTKTTYIQGQSLALEGLEVRATYNDGSVRTLQHEELTITGFDSSVPVEAQVVTVTFEGKEATFVVDILAKKLTSLRVKTLPTKMVYVVGQELNLQGLVVEGTFNDGSKKELDESGVTYSGYDKNTLGEQTITLAVDQVKTTFTVEVIQKIATQLDITKEPTKTTYIQGQSLVLTGLEVQVTYNDGSVRTLQHEELTITGFDSSVPHEGQVITVSYEGQKATFLVHIEAKVLVSLEIEKLPRKIQYVVGQPLDLTGIKIMGAYNDGTIASVDPALLTVSGFDKNILGVQTVTLAVGPVTTTFTVEVIEKVATSVVITKEPTKTTYIQGQSLALSGLVVRATFNDGSERTLNHQELTITGFDSTKAVLGQVITVQFDNQQATFQVDILAKVLVSIKIEKLPSKTRYLVGQSLDITGIVVKGTYNDGDVQSLVVTKEHFTGFSSIEVSEFLQVTVSYEGKEATFTVEILDEEVLRVEMDTLADTLNREDALALRDLIYGLEDTEENAALKNEFRTVLQEVEKRFKIQNLHEAPHKETPSMVLDEETLKLLHIEEVMEDDVTSLHVVLKAEILQPDEVEAYAHLLGEDNILMLYNMSLVKVLGFMDGSESERSINNGDIRGKLTLRIAVPKAYETKDILYVIYISAEGLLEKLETRSEVEDGVRYLYFETDHFSLYGIAAEEEATPEEPVVDDEDENTPETPGAEEEEEKTPEAPSEDNEPEDEKPLPSTGEQSSEIFMILGIVALAGGTFFLKRRKIVKQS